MSAASYYAFEGLTAGRKRLAELAAALRSAPEEVRREAGEEVRAMIEKIARSKVTRHTATGYAAGTLEVTAEGGLVLTNFPRYLDYHNWWPYRRGVPPFVVKGASVIFARKLVAHLGLGGYDGAELAGKIVAEADAADAERAKKKAETKERARIRREERAYNRRVKAQEDRE